MSDLKSTIVEAVIGVGGTAVAATIGMFGSAFLAEHYRRSRDARAIASGLAAELTVHLAAAPNVRRVLQSMEKRLADGRPLRLDIERESDKFYEANVGKIGLLEPELAERVIKVYQHIASFRSNFAIVLTGRVDVALERDLIHAAMQSVKTAEDLAAPLVVALRSRAGRR